MGNNTIILLLFYSAINALIAFAEPEQEVAETQNAGEMSLFIGSSSTLAPRGGKIDCLEPTQSKVSVFETQKEGFVDESRDIKAVFTDLVVNEFFRTPESLYNFFETTYTTIDKELDAYRKKHDLSNRSIFFIFKGGNVLKMLANAEILNRLPAEARSLLESKFGQYFKRSDADFSVFIDPNLLGKLDYDVAIEDIVEIVANALNTVRDQFTANPKNYFSILQGNASSASQVLSQYMKTLNELKLLNDPNVKKWYRTKFIQMQLLNVRSGTGNFCPYNGGFDFQQVYVPKPTDKVVSIMVGDKPHWLANSTNLALEFPRPGDDNKIAKFHLLREKVQFQVVSKKGSDSEEKILAGELIDVSIPHQRDTQLKDVIKHYDQWIKEYAMVSPDGKRSFVFKSESIEGLLADISEILFIESPRPWDNSKFDKRINRLFFLALIDIFKTIGTGSSETENYFDAVENTILAPALTIFSSGKQQLELLSTIKSNVNDLINKWPQLKMMNNVWEAIAQILLDRIVNNPNENDKTQFSSFVDLLRENINVVKSLKSSAPQKIENTPVYEINVTNLY